MEQKVKLNYVLIKKLKVFLNEKKKGKLILGVLTLKELSKLTGFKNQGQVRGLMIRY